jgi:hypothetical protein
VRVRTITTPGGQLVQVIPDAAYASRHDVSERSLRAWQSKRPVLGALWLRGPVEDESGQATAKLHELAAELGYEAAPSAITALLGDLAPAVQRERRGKRTYRIELDTLPELWATRLLEDEELTLLAHRNGDGEAPREAPEATEALPAPIEAPEAERASEELLAPSEEAPSLEVTSSVAMALLTRVVEIISTGSSDETSARLRSERDDARDRLRSQTEHSEKLRRDLRATGDEVAALKLERDGLRKRVRISEENLRKATSPDVQRTVDELVRRELDKLMRAAPAPGRA